VTCVVHVDVGGPAALLVDLVDRLPGQTLLTSAWRSYCPWRPRSRGER
jgi:hypothetical protein